MTITVASAVFVDTNILVYFTFDHFPWHTAARAKLTALAGAAVRLTTSRQVLREFLAVTTRAGFMSPMPPPAFLARTMCAFESRFELLEEDEKATALLLELIETPGARGRQVHDANLVAIMRRHGITTLLML
jgi:predicted nucleic acid-binding protein